MERVNWAFLGYMDFKLMAFNPIYTAAAFPKLNDDFDGGNRHAFPPFRIPALREITNAFAG